LNVSNLSSSRRSCAEGLSESGSAYDIATLSALVEYLPAMCKRSSELYHFDFNLDLSLFWALLAEGPEARTRIPAQPPQGYATLCRWLLVRCNIEHAMPHFLVQLRLSQGQNPSRYLMPKAACVGISL
jgi:hypothetical protein